MLYNMRKEYILHTSKGMEKMYATTDLEIIKLYAILYFNKQNTERHNKRV